MRKVDWLVALFARVQERNVQDSTWSSGLLACLSRHRGVLFPLETLNKFLSAVKGCKFYNCTCYEMATIVFLMCDR